MDRCVGAAARLPESDRKDLAIQALAQSATVSDLAARHGVSRKFVYQQTHIAHAALDDAFLSAAPQESEQEVLFELAVTKAWLRQGRCCRDRLGGVRALAGVAGWSLSDPGCHLALQAERRPTPPHSQADVQGHELGGV